MLGKLRRRLHHRDEKIRRQTICENVHVGHNAQTTTAHPATFETVGLFLKNSWSERSGCVNLPCLDHRSKRLARRQVERCCVWSERQLQKRLFPVVGRENHRKARDRCVNLCF
ncbi:hypothetical protein Y032_0121g973 [Ancylostoma ceylanicum]|uniref:Uncharacterized protein n=1 Tax=Ancylostoma ceylanicum TaxID=53326 RepID=A0A016TAD8_9BILA|nr:hypothetical protein Y032_0121g973 [Ancylostoma ceylanicum]